jgi:hypothetical protein
MLHDANHHDSVVALLVRKVMNEIIARRFRELETSRTKIVFQQHSPTTSQFVANGEWRGWATSVQSLLRAAFGESSEQYKNFSTASEKCRSTGGDVRALFHIFTSAKEDFEGGYVFNVELRVSGEVFGDFVVLAQKSLDEGHKDVAAVLACAALEDALKRFAAIKGIDTENKTMTEVVNALKSGGHVAGAQKTLLDRMPTIRNYALHANWDKISEPDVGSVIGFVEQFLLKNFSN